MSEVKKKSGMTALSIILLLSIGVVVLGYWFVDDTEELEKQRTEDIQKIESDYEMLIENGVLIRINPSLNEAFVEPAIWNQVNVQTKEKVGRMMAMYCGYKKGTDLNWVNIKDNYTGKKLAKYSASWGLSIED